MVKAFFGGIFYLLIMMNGLVSTYSQIPPGGGIMGQRLVPTSRPAIPTVPARTFAPIPAPRPPIAIPLPRVINERPQSFTTISVPATLPMNLRADYLAERRDHISPILPIHDLRKGDPCPLPPIVSNLGTIANVMRYISLFTATPIDQFANDNQAKIMPLSKRPIQGSLIEGSYLPKKGIYGDLPSIYTPHLEEMRKIPLFNKMAEEAQRMFQQEIKDGEGFQMFDEDTKKAFAVALAVNRFRDRSFSDKFVHFIRDLKYKKTQGVASVAEFFVGEGDNQKLLNDCRITNNSIIPLLLEDMGIKSEKIHTFYGTDPVATCSGHAYLAIKDEKMGQFVLIDGFYTNQLNSLILQQSSDNKEYVLVDGKNQIKYKFKPHSRETSYPNPEEVKGFAQINSEAEQNKLKHENAFREMKAGQD